MIHVTQISLKDAKQRHAYITDLHIFPVLWRSESQVISNEKNKNIYSKIL